MADGNRQRCEACGCTFQYEKSPNNRPLPVQRVRTVYLKDTDGKLHRSMIGEFFVSHFETCSDPGRFSGRGRKS